MAKKSKGKEITIAKKPRQRRKPVPKPSEASEHSGQMQTRDPLAAIIAARVFEIERLKLGGADKNIIAKKEEILAALIAKSKSSQPS